MTEFIKPMLAVPGELPSPERDAEYGYEFKWDGMRALAGVEDGEVTVFSRRGDDISATYPELRGLGDQLAGLRVWLDGEVVTLRDGKPSFAALQSRIHANPQRARELARQQPVIYLAFDVLHFNGQSCLDMPYRQRRHLLSELALAGEYWHTPPGFIGDGDAVVGAAAEQQLEGVVAKRLDSSYRPGERSSAWVKIVSSLTTEVVIGGWRAGEGHRSSTFGSLMLGLPENGGLRYVGQVGTGFTDEELCSLLGRLEPLERPTSPFTTSLPRDRATDAHWTSPVLVGEVAFKGWSDGGRLREPRWRGLRPDCDPEELVR
jgi:bifunctional non-homologous end joining protein LigD